MPDLITRGFADILMDRLKAVLVASEAEQVLLDPLVGYDTRRDSFVPASRLKADHKPLVNIYFQALTPNPSGSSANGSYMEQVGVLIDMIINEPDPNKVPEGATADQIAEARLHYLREQVRVPLFDLAKRRFGFPLTIIGNISAPSYSKLENDDENAETAVIAGRWQFTVDYGWASLDGSGVPLAEISIDTSLFQALYVYPEAP